MPSRAGTKTRRAVAQALNDVGKCVAVVAHVSILKLALIRTLSNMVYLLFTYHKPFYVSDQRGLRFTGNRSAGHKERPKTYRPDDHSVIHSR